ncbi:unnamed protein product [Cuscuta campestris]|uniref:Integrase catalytic domain-containing protein n=1 Tax=Cuscuta campestris TaxID=132261 RepID=A0A484L0T0_9ASTE|nr:unnamed protein product [Cuscuta campestris]
MLRSPRHRMLARRGPSGAEKGGTSAPSVAIVRRELRRQRSRTKGYLGSLIKAYNGTTDPQDHLSKFYASMEAAGAPDEVKCRCFLATLEGSACDWFNRLPKGTIDDWDMLAEKFLTHFAANRRQRLPYSHLLNICIRKGEKVRDFIVRWEKEARDVHGADDQALVAMFQVALPRREKDLPNTPSLHRDALVVKMEINDAIVHRTLVDTGSSVNIMYEKTFQDLGLDRNDLKPVHTHLSGFTGDSIEAKGVITVPVIVGDGAHKAKLKMEFMVVSINCAHNMILGRPGLESMEAYVDVMIVKSKQATTHAEDLEGVFKIMEKYNLRLNPKKYTFGVQGGKFLGHMVSRRGIEPNPEKVRAILDMEATRNVKEVQCLTGKLAALSRFLSKVADRAAPFFQAVKKSRGFVWTEECQQSFESLKSYLLSPPVLAKPEAGETLYLYLGVSPKALSSVLVRDEGGAQHPVYYTAKTLRGAELRCAAQEPERPSRMSKWAVFLGAFQVEFKPRPAIKGQALADFVVECTSREEPSPEESETDDWWIVFIDGSSAAKNSGGGVVVIAPKGFRAYYSIRFGFKASNNEAEYEALLCEFEAKDERMKKYRDTALELLKSFTAYSVKQIPRAENAEADILSKLSSDTSEHIRRMANVEELSEPSIHAFPVAMICAQPRDWMDDIVAFLKDGALPDDAIKAKLVRTRAPGYTLEGEKLYKRAYNGTLLRCLRPAEAEQVMEEVHAGNLFRPPRSIREGTGEAFNKLYPHQHSYPVRAVGVDLVGALPRGTGNVRYVIVAIDYFTKWVEAAPLASITGAQCQKFLAKQVICRFGVPEHVITDNGTQFKSKPFNDFLKSWGIKHSYVSVGYPQTNGRDENANRMIVDGLKRELEACGREWAKELPYILWTYRTTPRRATGETPFALCYGFEARAPAEFSIATHREEIFDPKRNEEALAAELHLVHERREAAFIWAENYRRKVKSYHDGRVPARGFVEGDWVLRKRTVSRPLEGGKFAKNYEGHTSSKKWWAL